MKGDGDMKMDAFQGTLWRENLASFRKALREHPGIVFGFSCFWVWIWLIFQSLVFQSTPMDIGGIILPPWIIPLAAYAVTFFILGAAYRSRGFEPGGGYYLPFVAVVMVGGVTLALLLDYRPFGIPAMNTILFTLSGVLCGLGTSLLHMEWGRLMGRLGTRKTVFYGIAATLVAALVLLAISPLPLMVVRICVLPLPVVSVLVLMKELQNTPRPGRSIGHTYLVVPWKFLVTSFVQGLSFGIVIALSLMGDVYWPAMPLSAASFAASAVMVFGIIIFFKLDFNQLFYQVGFFLMAIGYLLFSVLGAQSVLGWFVQSAGYRVVDILMWALCAYLIRERSLPTNWVFAWTTCALLVGQTVGAIVGDVVLAYSSTTPRGMGVLAVMMVFVLLGVALLLFNSANIRSGWGMIKPGDEAEPMSGFDRACQFVCAEHGLTIREAEVFVLIARGRNREYICDSLTLSKETVKTHIRNIYRKLDIHSQQEGMTLVEEQERSWNL